jgi:transcription initiation factor TFIIB
MSENRRTLNMLQERRCPECAGITFIRDHHTGEITCTVCGLVLFEENLNPAPEWRAYTSEEKQVLARGDVPTSLRHFNMGFSTTFLPHHDGGGKLLPSAARNKMRRLQKWQSRAQMQSARDRNLLVAMAELSRLTDHLTIPQSVAEYAAFIYRKALHNRLVRGRSIHAIIAASLYLACRLMKVPRKLTLFSEYSGRTLKEISRCYRLIQQSLNIEPPIDNPAKYVPKIASSVELNQSVQNAAIQLIHAAQLRHAVEGKSPVAIAAAALYIAARLQATPITQKTIAAAADLTEVTIRNRYQSLTRILELQLEK